MGLADAIPEIDVLLKRELKLNVINEMSCANNIFTKSHRDILRLYLFAFGVFSKLLPIDESAKLHRLMCHVDRYLVNLAYRCRSSSEENKMQEKEFKMLYNKHLDVICPQLFTAWVDHVQETNGYVQSESDYDGSLDTEHPSYTQPHDLQEWVTVSSKAI